MVKRRQEGYNLVILVVAITVLNIMVAAAIPLWRTAIRREKEEELIFRGLQYAEGMRNFQRRFGRLPVRLEELVETKPRCMRRLWEDPITGKRDWVPIRVGVPDGGAVPPENPPDGDGGQGTGGRDGNVGLGPIRGVRSRSKGESVKTMFGQNRYDQWQFTVEAVLDTGGVTQGFGVPGVSSKRVPMRWVGRPFRPGLNPTGMGGMAPPPGNPPPGNPPPAPPPNDKSDGDEQ